MRNRISRDLRSKHSLQIISLDTVERLRKQLASQDKPSVSEPTNQLVTQEVQTEQIQEPLSPVSRVEEHKTLKEAEDAQMQSTQSLHSNVASDSGKVRNLLDKLKKVEDENVRLLLENKHLKVQAREQGNQEKLLDFREFRSTNSFWLLEEKFRHLSAPNFKFMTEPTEPLNKHKKEDKKEVTSVDSEIIDDDFVLDFDDQVEEIQEFTNNEINFDEDNNEQIDARSFEQETPKVKLNGLENLNNKTSSAIKEHKQLSKIKEEFKTGSEYTKSKYASGKSKQ